MITIGTDFSGVGSTNQALKRLGIEYKEFFACDMDKYARQTFIHNYGEPEYYPTDVYEREIPKEPLDLYVTTPPCQAFSLAGKRKGEEDKRGILFYNSHEFIQKNKPRYFCFENVKGLLSDDNGKTFARWCDLLGGKSVNGNSAIFPHDESVPYHIYFRVMNAKNYGIPQNRERVFIIGIRDDVDNNFNWPVEVELEKRLKDVLEDNVDEKYYLSDTMVNGFIGKNINEISNTIRVGGRGSKTEKHNWDLIQVKSATTKGYEIAEIGEDSINLEHPNSETRRGRVGKSVAQTLTTSCNQGIATFDTPKVKFQLTGGKWDKTHEQSGRAYDENGIAPTIHTMGGGNQEPKIAVENWIRGGLQQNQPYQTNGISPCLTSAMGMGGGNTPIHNYDYRIRKLTPRECFRLMDFSEDFTWPVSDSQAYKQAGNSVVVKMWELIFKKLFIK